MRRRNRFFSGALCAALLLSFAPAAQAQQPQQTQISPANEKENGAPAAVKKDGMTLTKTAVPTGAGMWDVTLSVADSGAQTLSGPMDIVLLLDCSVSMVSPVESKAKAAHAPPPTPHAAQGTNIAQGISAAQRTSAAQSTSAAQRTSAKMLPMLSFAALRPDESKRTGPASTGAARRAAVPAQAGATPTADVKQSTTRIAAAKDAAAEFLAALKSMGVPARVGVVAYAGTAQILLAPTSLINAQDAAAVQNAVGNLWQVAYGAKDLCYGGGGTNLEQAFSAAGSLLKKSDAAAKYVVVLGSSDPDTVGEKAQSCVVPQGDAAYLSEAEVTRLTKHAAQKLQKDGAARVFTVGIDTNALRGFASSGGACVSPANGLGQTLRELASRLPRRVQSPIVTEVLADGFAVVENSAVCGPLSADVEGAAQPVVTCSADGRTLRWSLGASPAQGECATLRYTACITDAAYTRAGEWQLLGSAALSCDAALPDGRLGTVLVPFPVPSVCYRTGTLRVYTSGLPAEIQGTAQSVGATLVTDTACFAVEKPAAPDGWRLDSVAVNGAQCTPAVFAKTTDYRLPVREGMQTVEYRYVPAPRAAVQWSYTVCCYRDGLLLPEMTYTATVPVAAPIVDNVRERLTMPENCCENPTCVLPRTLKADGETIRVDYLTLPRADAQVYVKHLYYEQQTDGPLAGTCVTSPAEDKGTCAVRDLFSPAYGGKIYMPVQAMLTTEPQTGSAQPAQATPQNIALGESFVCAQGVCYTLEIRYLPVSAPPVPQPASSAANP